MKVDILEAPEIKELNRIQSTINTKGSLLADRELELATIRSELKNFESHYMHEIGKRYVTLDELKAQIAELESEKFPGHPLAAKEAQEVRSRADASAREASKTEKAEKPFSPSPKLKAMYRKLAIRAHPDRATSPEDQEKRTNMFKVLNELYHTEDEASLHRLLLEWEFSPDLVEGEDAGAQLVRVIREIAQIEHRLVEIEEDLAIIKKSRFYELMNQVEEARKREQDLLKEMAEKLDELISQKENELHQM